MPKLRLREISNYNLKFMVLSDNTIDIKHQDK